MSQELVILAFIVLFSIAVVVNIIMKSVNPPKRRYKANKRKTISTYYPTKNLPEIEYEEVSVGDLNNTTNDEVRSYD